MKKTPYAYLRTKYPESEFVLIKEIADSTARRRYLDFMVVNLWESRGLAITGIEVKSYRSDWLNELKKPAKQELHVPYCDYFYLFTTDEKVAKLEEIPENWGWMTVRGDKVFTIKKAPKLEAKPIPKHLMVGMLRRAADKTDFVHKDTIKEEIEQTVSNRINQKRIDNERALNNYKDLYENLKNKVEVFEKETGLTFPSSRFVWKDDTKKFAEAVNFVQNCDIDSLYNKLLFIKESADKLVKMSEDSILKYNKLNESKNED
jgi:hypothetical protein